MMVRGGKYKEGLRSSTLNRVPLRLARTVLLIQSRVVVRDVRAQESSRARDVPVRMPFRSTTYRIR